MLKVIHQGVSRLEDGKTCHVEHRLDETPPKTFFLNTNLPVEPERRFTVHDARRVFDALVPARYRQPAAAQEPVHAEG